MTRRQDRQTPAQMLATGAVVALLIGAHFVRGSQRSPEERARHQQDRERRRAQKRDLEVRMRRARELDRQHWRQFQNDPVVKAEFQRRYYIPVDAPPATGTVSFTSESYLWAATETWTVTSGDRQLKVWHYTDGGYRGVVYSSPQHEYKSDAGGPAGIFVIGSCDGKPSAVQREIASLFALLQQEGHYVGQTVCVTLPDRYAVELQLFDEYAEAQGWPPGKSGEERRARSRWEHETGWTKMAAQHCGPQRRKSRP